MERKKVIRNRIKGLREAQTQEEWKMKTLAIAEKILSHAWFVEADTILCYIDFRKEAGTEELIERAWQLGKHVYVPKVTDIWMDFYEIHSFEQLSGGAFGVREPDAAVCRRKYEIKPSDASKAGRNRRPLMIMPGVAFDRKRNRIGYGGGYYDRYLAGHPELHTIAAAFELQLVTEIEAEETDIRPECIITEKEIY